MKTRIILTMLGLALAATACTNEETVDFALDQQNIEIGADGGSRTIRISSPDSWNAQTSEPWLSVSPANGRGSVECKVIIDSALTASARTGVIYIEAQNGSDKREIKVTQEGYKHIIKIDDNEVTVPNYAVYGQRYFDVAISTNTPFNIEIPDNAQNWLSYEMPSFAGLNRGLRPREINIRFNWKVSSQPERLALVQFVPKDSATQVDEHDELTVTQEAAPEIIPDTRAGDSVALLGIARSLNTWYSWESSEPMDRWSNVTLWEEGPNEGRVRRADFFLFSSKEELPYEVQYLTAAEELSFRSNENSFLYSLNTGEYITKLKNLKRLTLFAYGLTDLSEDFKNMESLEYLNIAANNFDDFPAVLKGGHANFPKLKELIMNANQRVLVYDINNYIDKDGLGGFYKTTKDTREFPRWLLEWEELETLALGVNYLQGTIPSLEDDPTWTRFYTEEDVIRADTLPSGNFADKKPDGSPMGIVGLPKVWPKMKTLGLNYNRITGSAPDWLLYHPALDWWIPFTFIFNMEGKDDDGKSAGFDNEPNVTMDYYYEFYDKKKNPYLNEDGELDDYFSK